MQVECSSANSVTTTLITDPNFISVPFDATFVVCISRMWSAMPLFFEVLERGSPLLPPTIDKIPPVQPELDAQEIPKFRYWKSADSHAPDETNENNKNRP